MSFWRTSDDVGPSEGVNRRGRLIVEQIDPRHLLPGGIDTCIHDIVQFAPDDSVLIAGITRDPSILVGEWQTVELAGRTVQFFPVARLDRESRGGLVNVVPHSLRVAIGLGRYRQQLSGWEIVQTHRVETGYVAGKILRPIRRIQFIHNDASGLTGANSDSAWKRIGWLYRWIERRTLPVSDGAVVFNRTDGPRVAQLQPRTLIAQTWFNADVFAGSPRARSDGSALRILFVGRLESQKDPELAISTLARLVERDNSAALTVVGGGSLEHSMRRLAQQLGLLGRVDFAGAVPRSRVAELMTESSVLLLPSHYEGSPRVIAEAGATGLPVVATSGGDPDEFLVRGINGIRVDSRDPSELADAVCEAAQYDPERCVEAASHRSAKVAIRAILGVGVVEAGEGVVE